MIEACRVGMKRLSFLKLIFNTFCLKRRPRKQKEADGETKRSERRRHDHSRRLRFCYLVLTGAERFYKQGVIKKSDNVMLALEESFFSVQFPPIKRCSLKLS